MNERVFLDWTELGIIESTYYALEVRHITQFNAANF